MAVRSLMERLQRTFRRRGSHEGFAPGDETKRDRSRIAYVGLIDYNKGMDVLLEAMARIVTRCENARLALVGGSYDRNTRLQEESLRQRVRELPHEDRVEFSGRQPPDEVARVMRESAVVVLPRRAEPCGSVLIERSPSGTPVVASVSGGPQEIVIDAVRRIVPVGNSPQLADALLDVMANADRYAPGCLREFALSRYRWSTIASQYWDFYADA